MPTKKKTRNRARTANQYRELQEHNDSFLLLMARFDRVDKDNKDIKDSVSKHIEKQFNPLQDKVEKHSTYWGLLIGLGGPFVLGAIAWFQGLFGK